jgi:hypothetical protein
MPSLDWIGKRAVLNHHRQVPYHLLALDPEHSVGDPASGNLLIEGDNLLALKALLPYYAGKVKCVYIDPPYNTGDENWAYNDAVNSAEMREWLGRAVGREAEDLCRHDKWLSMMYPRLSLLREFLREDGVAFVSIDEYEVGHPRLLMDEVFGSRNALGTLVWKRRSSSAMRGTPLSVDHEYVLVYGRDARATILHGLAKGPDDYPYEDERGRYASTDLTIGMGKDARPGQFYLITNPRTGRVYEPNPERVWRFWPATMQKVIEEGLIIWPDESPGNMQRPRYKTYYDPNSEKPKPVSSWIAASNTNDRELAEDEAEYGTVALLSGMTQEGGKLLQQMLGTKAFAYPKPLSLVRSLVRAAMGNLLLRTTSRWLRRLCHPRGDVRLGSGVRQGLPDLLQEPWPSYPGAEGGQNWHCRPRERARALSPARSLLHSGSPWWRWPGGHGAGPRDVSSFVHMTSGTTPGPSGRSYPTAA